MKLSSHSIEFNRPQDAGSKSAFKELERMRTIFSIEFVALASKLNKAYPGI